MLCEHSFVCSHTCHNAPEGLICSCPPHLHLQPDRVHCLESHPCEAWGICSQLCTPYKSRHKCSCLPGYSLSEDGFTCKSEDNATPYVIFSNRHELRGVDLHTFSVKALISSLKNTIAVDFYHSNDSDMVNVLVLICSEVNYFNCRCFGLMSSMTKYIEELWLEVP